MKSMGEKIRERRTDLGMTQNELATATDITARTISTYETDARVPRGINLKKLCRVLGVSQAYLTNPEIEDETYGLDEAAYLEAAHDRYGRSAERDLEELLQGVKAAFAGGKVPQEDKDKFYQAVTEAYFASKEDARERFTPKKYQK